MKIKEIVEPQVTAVTEWAPTEKEVVDEVLAAYEGSAMSRLPVEDQLRRFKGMEDAMSRVDQIIEQAQSRRQHEGR